MENKLDPIEDIQKLAMAIMNFLATKHPETRASISVQALIISLFNIVVSYQEVSVPERREGLLEVEKAFFHYKKDAVAFLDQEDRKNDS